MFDGRLPTYRLTWADPPVAGWLGECTPARQRQLKATLQDLARAQPRPNLAAIRRVAADILVCRPGELGRKAPWLERSWCQACAQADQSRARRASRQRGPGR